MRIRRSGPVSHASETGGPSAASGHAARARSSSGRRRSHAVRGRRRTRPARSAATPRRQRRPAPGRRQPLAGELQREIAAERVAGEGEARQAIVAGEDTHHLERVGGQPRVVEPATQVLGAAAIALVETHDVEAAGPGLVGHAAHVVPVTRPLEAVQQHDGQRAGAIGSPVAMAEDFGVVGDAEEPGVSWRQAREMAPPGPCVERHPMAAGEDGTWDERLRREGHGRGDHQWSLYRAATRPVGRR